MLGILLISNLLYCSVTMGVLNYQQLHQFSEKGTLFPIINCLLTKYEIVSFDFVSSLFILEYHKLGCWTKGWHCDIVNVTKISTTQVRVF